MIETIYSCTCPMHRFFWVRVICSHVLQFPIKIYSFEIFTRALPGSSLVNQYYYVLWNSAKSIQLIEIQCMENVPTSKADYKQSTVAINVKQTRVTAFRIDILHSCSHSIRLQTSKDQKQGFLKSKLIYIAQTRGIIDWRAIVFGSYSF